MDNKEREKAYPTQDLQQIVPEDSFLDPRMHDMTPIIKSLEFLMRETGDHTKVHRLITQTFKMVLLAQDIIDERYKD